jgi:hypothetical protein
MATESRVLHLGIHFKTKAPTAEMIEEVEVVLNKAKDWLRYAPNCWLIYTERDPKTWNARLKKIPWMAEQSYLLCAVDPKIRAGWLPRSVWDWIGRDRG